MKTRSFFALLVASAPLLTQAQPYHCESTDMSERIKVANVNLETFASSVSITIKGSAYSCYTDPQHVGRHDSDIGPGGLSAQGYQCPTGWWPSLDSQSSIFCSKHNSVIQFDPWTGKPGIIRDGSHNGPNHKHNCSVGAGFVVC